MPAHRSSVSRTFELISMISATYPDRLSEQHHAAYDPSVRCAQFKFEACRLSLAAHPAAPEKSPGLRH